MVVASINMYNLINNGLAPSATTKPKGFRFKFKDTTGEEWETFTEASEAALRDLDGDEVVGLQPYRPPEEEVPIASFGTLKVELAWNRFAKAVYEAAKETLPGKVVGIAGAKPEEEVALKFVVRAAEKTYKQATRVIDRGYEWRRTAAIDQLDQDRKRFNEIRERFNGLHPDQNLVDELDAPPAADAEDDAWRLWRSVVKKQWRESLGALQLLRKVESNKAIKEAIEERNKMTATETGKVLDSILGRGSGKVVLDRIQVEVDGNTVNETDPVKVKEKVAEWFQEWYRPRLAKPLEGRWKEQYQPKNNIDEEWYDGLMEAPTRKEFEQAVRTAPKLKAPGLSGITNDILQHLGEVGKFILYQIVSAGIVQSELPKAWKTGLLYCIPKTSEWTGNMAEIRPITLLEHARKIMFSILTTRLSTIMTTHGILRGPNFSVLKGTTTKDPIHVLQALMEDARESGREQWIVFQDMRRCFDSVNCGKDGMLSRALARLKVPEQFIRLCETISETKVNKVITDFGTTNEFQPSCGLDQGGVECPLLWRIAYDPLLCEVMDNCQGYQIRGPKGTPVVADIAFVDDTTWIAEGKKAMEHTLEVASEFFDLNGIEINGKKTEVIAINNKRTREDSMLQFGTPKEDIYPVKKKEAVRMLGVWVNAAGSPKPTMDLIENETDTICNILRRKAITDRQAVYIINSVLVNRIIYRTSAQIIPKTMLKRLTGKYMSLCKTKARLPSTTPNSIMEHHRFYAVKRLEDAQAEEQITGLWLRLNDTGLVGKIGRARLIQLQQQLQMEVSPTSDPERVKGTRHNFISSVCELMAERDIQFEVQVAEDFELAADAGTILEWFEGAIDEEIIKECHDLGIYFIEQVLSVNRTELISWTQLRRMVGSRRASKDSPEWFLRLQNFCATDRFTTAFINKWCEDRRAAMAETLDEEEEQAIQEANRLSEVPESSTEEEDEPSESESEREEDAPAPVAPTPAAPAPVAPAQTDFVPSNRLILARREGTEVRPRLRETRDQRDERLKAYKLEYYNQHGGPKLRTMDDAEDEFRSQEHNADKDWLKDEVRRVRNLAKLEAKERAYHARSQEEARRQQEAAARRQQKEARRQQEEARRQQEKQEAARRQKRRQERQAAIKNKALRRRVAQERRLKDAHRRRSERLRSVTRTFKARKARTRKLQRKYLQPEGGINEERLEQDARTELSKSTTPRERDLPRKDKFRDIYGLLITTVVEDAILEARNSLEGLGPLEFYSDGSLKDHGLTTISMAFGVVIKRPGTVRYRTVISGKVLGFASSTKAELVGLLATILACPRDTQATVFIDNQTVVDKFKTLVWLKHSNGKVKRSASSGSKDMLGT
ncbi:hypothetical protein EMPS_01762 [Entomortierella parvispora]|uniref:Reverse transcriptase domain-containing protein n=1 Tax=Entomortierella parvispora TaxID=205924 RepID=A0A9P3LSV0_9FUNG|nr:hypothetical protein EMPS_01762 [Entomortierella parvispora]